MDKTDADDMRQTVAPVKTQKAPPPRSGAPAAPPPRSGIPAAPPPRSGAPAAPPPRSGTPAAPPPRSGTPAAPPPRSGAPVAPPLRRPVEERGVSEESYNPFKHRHVSKPTTDCGALAHLLKTSLGSGILAMPMAVKNAGLILGVVGTVVIGVICTHCLQLLVGSSQVLCKKARVPELGYAETAETAFRLGSEKVKKWAKPLKIIITMQLLLSFVLGNTVYVVFMSETIRQVTDFYFNLELNVRYYMLMLWIPLILMCLFRSLKSLVPFSALANIFVIISFSITLYYIFREIHKPATLNYVSPWYKWPLFLTTIVFSLEGIGTVMSIENEMKNPAHLLHNHKHCCGILYISMSVVIALYAIIGFFGYLQYGENTEGSITLNLPVNEILAQTVKILIALAIFFTYALQFYVPINITKNLILTALKKKNKVKEKYYIYIDTAVRVSLVSLTIIVAMLIPKLEPVITLVGAVCFSMLGLTFPPLIDTVVREPEFGRYKWRLVKNILIIIFSVIVLVSGTYAGIISIIDVYIK